MRGMLEEIRLMKEKIERDKRVGEIPDRAMLVGFTVRIFPMTEKDLHAIAAYMAETYTHYTRSGAAFDLAHYEDAERTLVALRLSGFRFTASIPVTLHKTPTSSSDWLTYP